MITKLAAACIEGTPRDSASVSDSVIIRAQWAALTGSGRQLVRLARLPAARSFGLKTSFFSVISKRRWDKAEHNPCDAVDRPRSAKGAVIF